MCEGRIEKTARFLGLNETTIRRRIKGSEELQELRSEGKKVGWESDWSTEKLKKYKGGLYKGFNILDSEEGTTKWLCEQRVRATINKAWFQHCDKTEQKKIISRIRRQYLTSSRDEI